MSAVLPLKANPERVLSRRPAGHGLSSARGIWDNNTSIALASKDTLFTAIISGGVDMVVMSCEARARPKSCEAAPFCPPAPTSLGLLECRIVGFLHGICLHFIFCHQVSIYELVNNPCHISSVAAAKCNTALRCFDMPQL